MIVDVDAGEDDNAEDAPAPVGHLHESERNCPLGTSPWTPLAKVILLEAMHQCDIYISIYTGR